MADPFETRGCSQQLNEYLNQERFDLESVIKAEKKNQVPARGEDHAKRNVTVSILGLHASDEEGNAMEMKHPGVRYKHKDTTYIKYQQYEEESDSYIDHLIKIKDGFVELKRSGAASSHMQFKKDMVFQSQYQMGAGAMLMETRTKDVLIEELEAGIKIALEYELYLNETFISESRVAIWVENS